MVHIDEEMAANNELLTCAPLCGGEGKVTSSGCSKVLSTDCRATRAVFNNGLFAMAVIVLPATGPRWSPRDRRADWSPPERARARDALMRFCLSLRRNLRRSFGPLWAKTLKRAETVFASGHCGMCRTQKREAGAWLGSWPRPACWGGRKILENSWSGAASISCVDGERRGAVLNENPTHAPGVQLLSRHLLDGRAIELIPGRRGAEPGSLYSAFRHPWLTLIDPGRAGHGELLGAVRGGSQRHRQSAHGPYRHRGIGTDLHGESRLADRNHFRRSRVSKQTSLSTGSALSVELRQPLFRWHQDSPQDFGPARQSKNQLTAIKNTLGTCPMWACPRWSFCERSYGTTAQVPNQSPPPQPNDATLTSVLERVEPRSGRGRSIA